VSRGRPTTIPPVVMPAERPRPSSTRAVIATADPLFAALCQRALEGAQPSVVAAVAPAELLETLRQHLPEVLILDVDGEDPAAVKARASKAMLVSDARVVLVSAYLAPGSPGLGALLQTVAATFVQKPRGPSSLGLADDGAPAFVAALQAAIAAHDADDLIGHGFGAGPSRPAVPGEAGLVEVLPEGGDIDAAWDALETQPAPGRRGAS
jgi:CheY-like chemotaxis protein